MVTEEFRKRSGVTRRNRKDRGERALLALAGTGRSFEGETRGTWNDLGWAVGRSISSVTITIFDQRAQLIDGTSVCLGV